jgi:preprotein translocase subunit SecD
MLLYYRALAAIILVGVVLSGTMLYAVISLLSAQRNLTLTIAGCAGIIVSVGVTVDSYVVFFERLKDEVRHGRSLRNSAARGFSASWRTILNGNLASLIGALVLFWLSVGSVRGFAFFLALSTIIDLIVAYFFTRPVMLLLARSGKVGTRKVFGIDTSTRDIAGGVS